ncbi:MAG TPA: hypothetical protein VF706_00480 [Solirubrobacteraceae bacterium]
MSTALADPPAAPPEQQTPASSGGGAPTPTPGDSAQLARACANCGAALADGQDWCLNCGAGAPDSLGSRTPTWRSAAVILTTLALLVAGAAGAAYAALSKHATKAPAVTTVAQAPPPAATPPPATTPVPTTPSIGTPTTIKPVIPLPKAKIPVTPTITPTPAPKPTTPVIPSSTGGETTPSTSTPKSSGEGSAVAGEAHPEALLLDTNAASTYNPYNYAAGNFGDPSLAIDGDTTTGWTALVEPSVAPKMAEGLVIDLNTPRKLSAVALTTSTPGMTVQVYGSSAATLPTSITDPAWAALTPSFVEHKRHVRIKLGAGRAAPAAAAKKPYRFITLWISQAPAASVGTPQAPGHVTVDELELFPAKKK